MGYRVNFFFMENYFCCGFINLIYKGILVFEFVYAWTKLIFVNFFHSIKHLYQLIFIYININMTVFTLIFIDLCS